MMTLTVQKDGDFYTGSQMGKQAKGLLTSRGGSPGLNLGL